MTSPRVFTVSFGWDAHAADEQQFDDQLTTSAYWKTVTNGFCDGGGACVGPGVSAGAAVLPQSAATLNALTGPSDFWDRVLGPALANGTLPPTADDLLYVFYVPTDWPFGGVAVRGYHGSARFPPNVLGPVMKVAVVKGYNLAVAAHEIGERRMPRTGRRGSCPTRPSGVTSVRTRWPISAPSKTRSRPMPG